VVGAIGLLIVIFATGWVVTSSSAQDTAEEMAETAVVDRLAAICVAQFQQDPNREERLKELKETGYGKRDDYVDERGWATMSGDESPDRQVADECARQLFFMKLDQ
jgi:cobalamin biosynthesis protein CbiD